LSNTADCCHVEPINLGRKREFNGEASQLMSFINIRDKRLKQEAIIGILYAFASALTVLFISKTAHGDSDIQEVLFGNILAVDWDKISTMGIVFGATRMILSG
jgi:ABC-type Mn2+/Zn2+ transport system permease subunit